MSRIGIIVNRVSLWFKKREVKLLEFYDDDESIEERATRLAFTEALKRR